MVAPELGRSTSLVGRAAELETCGDLLEAVRAGESRVLVLSGDPGVGKSALLDQLTSRATDCQVFRVVGVQSEMELVFAGLHQLCAPMLDRVETLPDPQRDALRAAFGLCEGSAPKPFLIGLAVLGLLAETSAERPVLCVVDDFQWLDRASAQTLGFVARRLAAESVGLIFGARDITVELVGIPELPVRPLPYEFASELLNSALTGSMDVRVRDQIVTETGGNPLALLEWVRSAAPHRLAGGFGLPTVSALSSRIEEGFGLQLTAMPVQTQRLLRLAAADPSGDAALVWRAATTMGIPFHAATPAVEAGLAEFGARVWFRHPLLRSAVYRSASVPDRHDIHVALAEATDAQRDPDRRAWHRAQAASAPDEDVAADLERSAARAQARGGPAAAAAFLERAGLLSEDEGRRGARLLSAGQANLQAGNYDAALRLLANVEAGPLDPLQHATADLLHGQVAFASGMGSDAPPLLLRAAKRLQPFDIDQAREIYLAAWMASFFAGNPVSGGGLPEVAKAVRDLLPRSDRPGKPELVLDALSSMIVAGPAAAAPAMRVAVELFAHAGNTTDEVLRWSWFAHPVAIALWDHDAWRAILVRYVESIRAAGALDMMPVALSSLATVTAWSGDFAATKAMMAESDAICQATGASASALPPILLACFRGDRVAAERLARPVIDDAAATGNGCALIWAQWVMAVLYNGLGQYRQALDVARSAVGPTGHYILAHWPLPEVVEAASRIGDTGLADEALLRLEESVRPGSTDTGLGLLARSRALTSDGEAAEVLYREAVDRLGRTCLRPELARAHLLYGEWLRRAGRRVAARAELRIAHEMLAAMDMGAFAERARRELLATGERVGQIGTEHANPLTAQEALIARLARDGRTNPEIGAQLFLSARTVEWHLHKVFAKLGIASRRELADALAGAD
ncbi:ATP-binding protein [Nocardia tengchongensis]|uniref:ATP-binding protein n=1 Tax=Nocardia tengchongensis TaxID=2055889 RepID=UPI00361643D8